MKFGWKKISDTNWYFYNLLKRHLRTHADLPGWPAGLFNRAIYMVFFFFQMHFSLFLLSGNFYMFDSILAAFNILVL